MASVNKVILIGNLGKDPEIRFMTDGTKVATFSVATSESWKDKTTGEKKERTEWHRISVMSPTLADVVQTYLHKGSKVYVEGQLRTRKWVDQNGQEKQTTEILISPFKGSLTLLDSQEKEVAPSVSQNPSMNLQRPPVSTHTIPAPSSQPLYSPEGPLDDDIPF